MKKIIKLTERDLTRIVKRVISEDIEMMDVSSDSDYYKAREREVSIPGNDLSILISAASRFCRNQMGDRQLGLMSGSELEDKSGSNDCYRVELLNRQYGNI
jgi:hypothetical protein